MPPQYRLEFTVDLTESYVVSYDQLRKATKPLKAPVDETAGGKKFDLIARLEAKYGGGGLPMNDADEDSQEGGNEGLPKGKKRQRNDEDW